MAWRGRDPLVGRYGVGTSIQPDRNTPAHRYPATKPHATELQDDFAGALYDSRTTVTLTPWDKGPRTGFGSMFVATVRLDYRTRNLPETLRFTSVADHAEYRRFLRDPATSEVWLCEPTVNLDATDPELFQLAQCVIDGEPRPITRERTDTTQTFTVVTGPRPPGTEAHVAYTHRALITQHGHQLFLDLPKPIKGLNVEFHYGRCGIRHVNILDFITSSQRPRISRSPSTVPSPSINISFDGWTFPKSGIAFTWVLDREVHPTPDS